MSENLTIFQRLGVLLDPQASRRRESKPVKVVDPLLVTQSPEEFKKTKTELQQQKYLSDMWSKVDTDMYAKSLHNEPTRLAAYFDFDSMEFFPELSASLDLYSEEATCPSEQGKVLTIFSESERVRSALQELFNKTLDIETNLQSWTRTTVKYGDNFVLLHLDREHGIVGCSQLPVADIDRVEDGDITDHKKQVSFRYRSKNLTFQPFQVAHFRLMGDDRKLPYGCSILEKARRIYRQLIMVEDAMLVYRVVRAPERRIFKVFVGNMDDVDVEAYIQKIANKFKRTPIIDGKTGQIDLRYNQPVWRKTPIPLLDGRTISIEELSQEIKEGKENYVYSIQDDTQKIVPGKVIWCDKNYVADMMIKVWLDDGNFIMTAPEHPFILRNGGVKRADELLENDSLMPYYYQITEKGKFIYDNGLSKFVDFNIILKDTKKKKRLQNVNYIKKCVMCSNDIHNKLSFVKFNKQICCSNQCYYKLRSEKYRGDKIYNYKGGYEHNCLNCDTLFNGKSKENKFCSIKCRSEHKIGKGNGPKKICDNKCEGCGKTYTITPKNKYSKFCSQTCRLKWFSRNFTEKNSPHYLGENIDHTIVYKGGEWREIRKKIINNYNNCCLGCGVNGDEQRRGLSIHHLISPRFFENHLNSNYLPNLIPLCDSCHTNCPEHIAMKKILSEKNIENNLIKECDSEVIIENYSKIANLMYEERLETILYEKDENIYLNHKVSRIEKIYNSDDVYCMTVVGLNGEDDRHNFATLSLDVNGNVCKSGVFVKNSSVDTDIFVPTRSESNQTVVDTLPGAAPLPIDDIEYLQSKLFAAIRVPKPFLGFTDAAGDGKNLSLLDIRFSRSVNRVQKAMIQELNKIAIIHLFMLGYEEDLDNFTLALTNPSTQAELLKIEQWSQKIDLYSKSVADAGNGFSAISMVKAKKDILGMSDEEITLDLQQQRIEKAAATELSNTDQVIVKTGIFDKVDRIYGIKQDENSKPDQQKPKEDDMGGFGGGAGPSSFGGGGSSDFGGELNPDENNPENPEGEKKPEDEEKKKKEPQMGGPDGMPQEGFIGKRKPLITERLTFKTDAYNREMSDMIKTIDDIIKPDNQK